MKNIGRMTPRVKNGTRSRRLFVRSSLLVSLAGAVVSMGLASASSAATKKPVKPDYAYFSGKTITYIVPQSPGGSYSQALIPAIPIVQNFLHVTINAVYVPQANSVVGQDEIAAATPDGLTIGTLSVSADLANDLEGSALVNFALLKESLIAGNYLSPEVIVACNKSPFTTVQQVIKSPTPYQVINTGSGPGFELIKALFNSYNSPIVSLSGFATGAAQTSACLGGDAPLALQTLAGLTVADFQQGLVHALVITTIQPPSSQFAPYLKGVPSLTQVLKKYPPTSAGGREVLKLIGVQYGKTGLGIVVAGPKGIPANILLALQNAFKAAYKNPTVAAQMTTAGLVPGWVSPAAAKPFMQTLLKHEPLISRFVEHVYGH